MVAPCVDSRKPSGRGSIDAIVSISLPVMVLFVTFTWNPSWAKISLTSGARRTIARVSPMAEVSSSNAITIPFRPGMRSNLNFYSLECLLGAEEGGLDGKLKEEGAPRIALANSSAGICNNVTGIVTHWTGLFVLKAKEG